MVILFDYTKTQENVHSIIFSTKQQELVSRLLISRIKDNQGTLSRTEMSVFANNLHDGAVIAEVRKENELQSVKISYNKKQFYDRILNPMKTMGLVEYDSGKRVYRLSEKFHTAMTQIGKLWLDTVRNQEEQPIKILA